MDLVTTPLKVYRLKKSVLTSHNCREDESLGYFDHKQQSQQHRKIPTVERGGFSSSGDKGAVLTSRVLSSQSQQCYLLQSNSSPRITGKENQDSSASRPWGSMTGNVCGLGERGRSAESRGLGICCFILALRSPQTAFLERIRTFLNMTAPCVGSETAVQFISLTADLWTGETASLFID